MRVRQEVVYRKSICQKETGDILVFREIDILLPKSCKPNNNRRLGDGAHKNNEVHDDTFFLDV